MKKIPTVLVIMDGFGLDKPGPQNAISQADTPELDRLFAQCPNTELSVSGEDVGLPEGQIGNSEVGHTNLGAGRVVFQDLPRISNAIRSGAFFENPAYLDAVNACMEKGSSLHIMGLLSDGGVHSHMSHFYAMLEMAAARGLQKIYIHAFLDGRDVAPSSGAGFVRQMRDKCTELGAGKLATVMGRFYAMDRDNRWDRVQKAYEAMVMGRGVYNPDPVDAVLKSYEDGVTDEFVLPVICDGDGLIAPGDSVVFMNYRPDRARELTRALTDPAFDGFVREKSCLPLTYCCTTQYDAAIGGVSVAFGPDPVEMSFGEYVSSLGLSQLRIAETEKYAHVTFFFNGGTEAVYPGEDRVLIPSPKDFPTYDLIPEMSAREVADETVKRILSGKYDVVICNLANCDMVGHTGFMEAAIKAVEVVDESVGRIVRATADAGGTAVITADHGNAEKMRDENSPYTAHTTNKVPLIIAGAAAALRPGRLADVAPTLLALMGLKKPAQMTGESLIVS